MHLGFSIMLVVVYSMCTAGDPPQIPDIPDLSATTKGIISAIPGLDAEDIYKKVDEVRATVHQINARIRNVFPELEHAGPQGQAVLEELKKLPAALMATDMHDAMAIPKLASLGYRVTSALLTGLKAIQHIEEVPNLIAQLEPFHEKLGLIRCPVDTEECIKAAAAKAFASWFG